MEINLLYILVAVTSEDVCWSIRNVKFVNESFYNMRCLVIFITAICVLFLLKLKWPKNKSVYEWRAVDDNQQFPRLSSHHQLPVQPEVS